MIIEIQASESDVPSSLSVEYIGQTSDGYDAAIISNIWSAQELQTGSVILETMNDEQVEVPDASILKSGASTGAFSIPGSEFEPKGTVSEGSHEAETLKGLSAYLSDHGVEYATPEEITECTNLDTTQVRNALAVMYSLKGLLSRRPSGTGRGGIQYKFGLSPAAEHELQTL